MQVGTVDHEIGGAIALTRNRAEIEKLPGLARAPEPDLLAGGFTPDFLERGFEAEREQGVRTIGRYLHAGADLGEFARLFDHADTKAAPQKGQRRGEAA